MNKFLQTTSQLLRPRFSIPSISIRGQAVGKKIVAAKEDKSFVDTDAEKLAKHVCINYLVEGEEPGPKILPDSEYPEWLFKLNLADPLPLEEMNPEEHGWLYWRALQNRRNEQARRIKQLKLAKIHLQNLPNIRRPKTYHR
ncbi:unnamed protein product [Bursaphelenchus xylophilus]|uniref:Large ribosomal subunit protein mL54 n=1 Tax=Bursaphelenchus xylophilus TaxID=6326 RepID=A0A1I7S1Z1_BURXY|nr:unnamed protein product [Bursaphelenchus xylophilus]CAG9090137.1 unnamed protein product [Bursaphelenchus xylophilus]